MCLHGAPPTRPMCSCISGCLPRTACISLALRTRALCWRSSAPEPLGSRASLHPAAATSALPPHCVRIYMLGSPCPLGSSLRAAAAWAHVSGHSQPPAAPDCARADSRAIAISACTPSHGRSSVDRRHCVSHPPALRPVPNACSHLCLCRLHSRATCLRSTPSACPCCSASSTPCPLSLPHACLPPWPEPLQPNPCPRCPTSPLHNASLQSIVSPPISFSSTRNSHLPLFFSFARSTAVTIIINGCCPLVTCRFPLSLLYC
jgi:hypothetical protein